MLKADLGRKDAKRSIKKPKPNWTPLAGNQALPGKLGCWIPANATKEGKPIRGVAYDFSIRMAQLTGWLSLVRCDPPDRRLKGLLYEVQEPKRLLTEGGWIYSIRFPYMDCIRLGPRDRTCAKGPCPIMIYGAELHLWWALMR
jgi:hypothetical protein